MLTVDVEEATARLEELVALAVKGEPFLIAVDGKPVVKVEAICAPAPGKQRRIGFMEGLYDVPDDFDTMFQEEIEEMFYGGSIFPDENDAKPR